MALASYAKMMMMIYDFQGPCCEGEQFLYHSHSITGTREQRRPRKCWSDDNKEVYKQPDGRPECMMPLAAYCLVVEA